MGDFNQTSTGSKRVRTRRSEIISGLTVVLSIPLITFAWNIYKDIQEFKNRDTSRVEARIQEVREQCRALVEEERERAQEIENDLKLDLRELRTSYLNRR